MGSLRLRSPAVRIPNPQKDVAEGRSLRAIERTVLVHGWGKNVSNELTV